MKRLIFALAMLPGAAMAQNAHDVIKASGLNCSLTHRLFNTPGADMSADLRNEVSQTTNLLKGYIVGVTTAAGGIPYTETLAATLLICEERPELHFTAAVTLAMATVSATGN